MRRRIRFRVRNLDHMQIRMRNKFDIRNDAETDAPGNRQPDGLLAADLHHRVDHYARIAERCLEGTQRLCGTIAAR